jgi:hypothetical protein
MAVYEELLHGAQFGMVVLKSLLSTFGVEKVLC